MTIRLKHKCSLAILFICCLCGSATINAQTKNIKVAYEKVNDGYRFYARNDLYGPANVKVSFKKLRGWQANITLPYKGVVPARSKKHILFSLKPKPVSGQRKFSYLARFFMGDPRATHDDTHQYLYPFAHGSKFRLSQIPFSGPTHQDVYAIDFSMPSGTPVTAARSGIVLSLEEKFAEGGPDPALMKQTNYVVILHKDGSMANYSHFQKNGVLVKVGDKVRAGQKIGLSGNSGYSSGPHLHFHVFTAASAEEKDPEKTLPIQFLNVKGNPAQLNKDRWYYAMHPGKPDFNVVLGQNLTNEDFAGYLKKAPKTNKVKVESEKVDDVYVFYAFNGFTNKKSLELEFEELDNLQSSKPLPYKTVLPPLSKTYLLNLKKRKEGSMGYSMKIRYR